MVIQIVKMKPLKPLLGRAFYLLWFMVLTLTNVTIGESQTHPQEIPFQLLQQHSQIVIPDGGLKFTVPKDSIVREVTTGLSLKEYSQLRTFLEDAHPIGTTTPITGNSSAVTLSLKAGGELQIWADGLIKGKLPNLKYWVNLFKVSPNSAPQLIALVAKQRGVSRNDSTAGEVFTFSASAAPLALEVGSLSPSATASLSRISLVTSNTNNSMEKGGGAQDSNSSGNLGSAVGSQPMGASTLGSRTFSGASTGSLSIAGGTTGSGGGSTTPVAGSFGGTSGSGASAGGEMPGDPGTIGGGDTGEPNSCAQIHLGKPTEVTVAGGDANMATSDADYIPVFGGVIRSAWNTVTAMIGPVAVGQTNPNAVASDSKQTALEGGNYAMTEAAGMQTESNTNGGTAFTSSSGSSGSDVLYFAGLGYPKSARGFAGFEWEKKELSDGRTAAEITAPGSASNALIVFASPNKVGYSPVQEVRLSQGRKMVYSFQDQWNGSITFTDPTKGTLVTRWTKQPSDNPNIFDVIKTIQVGDTIIEDALFTFTHAGGGIFNLTKYKNLSNGATFNLAFGKGSIPLQWTSKAHTAHDTGFGNDLQTFDGISGDLTVSFIRDTTQRQQIPGSTPVFRMPIEAIEYNSRQFRSATNTLNQHIDANASNSKLFSTFLNVSNPKSTVREYGSDWKKNENNYAAATIVDGVRTEYERNTEGAVIKARHLFANGTAWESTFERDGYWLKSAQFYDGTAIKVIGNPIYPDAIIYTTALGEYRTELAWDTYTSDDLTQHLLTSITEIGPDGFRRTATFTWDRDTLRSYTTPDGITTETTVADVTTRAASGNVITRVLSTSTFTGYQAVFPTTFSAEATLSGGTVKQLMTLNGAVVHESTTTLGKGASGVTTQNTSGVTKNAANESGSTSSTSTPRHSIVKSVSPAGTSEQTSSQSIDSLTPTCTLRCNGIQCGDPPCSPAWKTAQKQSVPIDGPKLSIVSTETFKENGRYYLKLSYANTVLGKAAAMVVKGSKAASLEEFPRNPAPQCGKEELNLGSIQKASTLNCEILNTGGLIDDNGNLINEREWPMPPRVTICEIDKEDACGGMKIQLAAGSTVERTSNQTEPGSVYQQGPAFKKAEKTNGFSGVVSNRYDVPPNPEMCS